MILFESLNKSSLNGKSPIQFRTTEQNEEISHVGFVFSLSSCAREHYRYHIGRNSKSLSVCLVFYCYLNEVESESVH